MLIQSMSPRFFFFNDTATTEIYTLSLHDALPILISSPDPLFQLNGWWRTRQSQKIDFLEWSRSEEHTSELQSRQYLVCRLLLHTKDQDPSRKLAAAYHVHSVSETHAGNSAGRLAI